MGFKCGIIGLPNVGKSTLFNALTQSNNAEAANYPFATIEPNIGRIPIPDERLKILSTIGKSKETIPTYIDFVDIAGLVEGASKGEGLGNKFLSHIREVDAIAHVVRCFENENITHISSEINPIKDIEIITTELKLADFETIKNKIDILEKKIKSGDEIIQSQLRTIKDIENKLNNDEKIIFGDLSKEDKDLINSLNLITLKPLFYICNVDEKSALKENNFTEIVKQKAKDDSNKVVIISAEVESQISEFENEIEKKEMLKELGLKETGLTKVIHTGYELLNLITFFTCGPKESRAWTIPTNTVAPKAAGKIHTDFEKGFIRAETISYEDFVNFKGEIGSREAGKLRLEGKDYIIQDGDILNFLFNV